MQLQGKVYKDYEVPFGGLKVGVHHFDYTITEKFFRKFEASPIKNGLIRVDLDLDKRENLLTLDFAIAGTVNVECDRCLKPLDFPVEGTRKVYVKFAEEDKLPDPKDEDEDIIFISRAETSFNIAQLIYEFIILALPLQRVCPEDEQGNSTCNKEVLNILKQHKNAPKEVDPRWEALKKIKKL